MLNKNKKLLRLAKSKIKHLNKREYYGYFTLSEYLILIQAGILGKKVDIIKARMYKDSGHNNPNWYYFELGKLTLEQ